jgi:hypothetical protein
MDIIKDINSFTIDCVLNDATNGPEIKCPKDMFEDAYNRVLNSKQKAAGNYFDYEITETADGDEYDSITLMAITGTGEVYATQKYIFNL